MTRGGMCSRPEGDWVAELGGQVDAMASTSLPE
jgi:hypothetical protein